MLCVKDLCHARAMPCVGALPIPAGSRHASFNDLCHTLASTVPFLIAIGLSPTSSGNQAAAFADDVISKVSKSAAGEMESGEC